MAEAYPIDNIKQWTLSIAALEESVQAKSTDEIKEDYDCDEIVTKWGSRRPRLGKYLDDSPIFALCVEYEKAKILERHDVLEVRRAYKQELKKLMNRGVTYQEVINFLGNKLFFVDENVEMFEKQYPNTLGTLIAGRKEADGHDLKLLLKNLDYQWNLLRQKCGEILTVKYALAKMRECSKNVCLDDTIS